MIYNNHMEIIKSSQFESWLLFLRDPMTRARIQARIDNMANGAYGDHKLLSSGISELHFHFGAGYRVYYAQRGNVLILLLNGGDKSSQTRAINKAVEILKDWE